MSKLSVFLFGKHSKRTPFFYKEYGILLKQHFDFSSNPFEADIIVTGFIKDFKEEKEFVHRIKTNRPSSKLVVVSEEPLWDTIWTNDFHKKSTILHVMGKQYEVYQVNHYNSNVFDFEKYPYFLTTSNHFFSRYSYLFKTKSQASSDSVLVSLRSSAIKAAFIAEKRLNDAYSKKYPSLYTWGLSKYRTDVAINFSNYNITIEGKRWKDESNRQDMADWHLDKITRYQAVSKFMSAIENTYYSTYITEKIFDSFACMSIPIYVGGEAHKINSVLRYKSWVDIYGVMHDDVAKLVDDFDINKQFVEQYCKELENLSEYFSDSESYIAERKNTANKIASHLISIFQEEV